MRVYKRNPEPAEPPCEPVVWEGLHKPVTNYMHVTTEHGEGKIIAMAEVTAGVPEFVVRLNKRSDNVFVVVKHVYPLESVLLTALSMRLTNNLHRHPGDARDTRALIHAVLEALQLDSETLETVAENVGLGVDV